MPENLNQFQLVLFDFDGTIADTARDMINALNMLLHEYSMQTVEFEDLRAYVSNGTPALLKHGFNCSPEDENFDVLRKEFLRFYEENLCVQTVLYPGTQPILERCQKTGISWGIVTNKPEHLTRMIVQQLGVTDSVACIVGGDTLKYRKPRPEPVIYACDLAGIEPQNAIFVGDSWRDVEAGREAGLITVGASYGYIPPEDDPNEWNADFIIDSISDVEKILWAN